MDNQVTVGRVPTEQVALACLVGIIGGLLAPRAAYQNIDRALLVLLLTCLVAGLVLGGRERRLLDSVSSSSFAVAIFFSVTVVAYLVVRTIAGALAATPVPVYSGVSESAQVIEQRARANLPTIIVLVAILLGGSFLMTLFATIASRPLFAISAKLFAAGPEAIERTNKILVALASTVAALFALWLAFG